MRTRNHAEQWKVAHTNDDPGEGKLISTVLLVHHTDKSSVGCRFSHRCSMDQIFQSLYTQVTSSFCQHETDGIHKIGFSYNIQSAQKMHISPLRIQS